MHAHEILKTYGAVHIKDVISKEMANFLTSTLLLNSDLDPRGDEQVPNAKTVTASSLIFETLLERLWPDVEAVVADELIPTYSYARLYTNGDILEKHIDRPSCEISMTLQLGRSHHYSWPIYMGNNRFDMAEGDAVVYRGCDIDHWRNKCDGPDGYYSGQVFLHYVRANGQNAEYAGDKRWVNHPFKRFRANQMEQK